MPKLCSGGSLSNLPCSSTDVIVGPLQSISWGDRLATTLCKYAAFGKNIAQMTAQTISTLLERQLLLQFGDRLRHQRKAKHLRTVDVAARAGMSRNTLRAIESGDPAPSIGSYLRVMSVLGISGDLALLATDTFQPPLEGTAGGRSRRPAPVVTVHVEPDNSKHRLQDLQSLALHEEAVGLVKSNPELVRQAQTVVQRWLARGDVRSEGLWREWLEILHKGAWRKVLGRTRRAQLLRQASPLVTLLPDETRLGILEEVGKLRTRVVID